MILAFDQLDFALFIQGDAAQLTIVLGEVHADHDELEALS